MDSENQNIDKAGKSYWDKTERNQEVEMRAFAPASGVRHFARRMWHRRFEQAFAGIAGRECKLVELGCGGSNLLPYFARQFGFQVYGMDYSEQGCDLARRMCQAHGISSHIMCADFFNPPPQALEAFDVVFSSGVVEHFTDTAQTLSQFAQFLKPGGLMITAIPNMAGLTGMGQKLFAKEIFEKHVPLDRNGLHRSHEIAGLRVINCDHFMFVNFGVINLGQSPSTFTKGLLSTMKGLTGLAWGLECLIGPLPPNSISSPYIFCVARKL